MGQSAALCLGSFADKLVGQEGADPPAFQKEQQGEKLVMIPLNLDGHLFKDEFESGWKSDLIARYAPDFTNWKRNHDKFEEQVELVIQALRTDGGRLPEPGPKL